MTREARIYSDMIRDLLKDLTSRREHRRLSALERCQSLSEDSHLNIILRLLAQNHMRIAWQSATLLFAAIGVASMAYVYEGHPAFLPGLLGMLVASRLLLTPRQTERSLEALLRVSEDKRLIPILLMRYAAMEDRALEPRHFRIRDVGLMQLLPLVTIEDTEVWTTQQRMQLTALLRSPAANPELTLCVLHALTAVGDVSALPSVRLLARLQPTSWFRRAGREPSPAQQQATATLQEAAHQCLEAIQLRAEQRRLPRTLLRAYNGSARDHLDLLHPIETGGGAQNSQLLRATNTHFRDTEANSV